jgi:16S rRNA (cytosine1402-N4)-methyltransferase
VSLASPIYHLPVLADAVRAWAEGSRRAVDATVGGGGHAALLRDAGAEILALDRDPEAIAAARGRLGSEHIHYVQTAYGTPAALDAIREFRPDRILLDLGISSHQVDAHERGFTFRPGAPLDMRMTPGEGPSARDVLNTWPEERLGAAFADFGDERPARARALAKQILRRRLREPFMISDDFVNAIRAVLGPRSGPPDFARLFQAVRIAVNDELGDLEKALPLMRDALARDGKIGVISYHSGEDRVVKHAFREWGRSCVCPPGQPICTCRGHALGVVLTRRPVLPDASEIAANPRARSARFRAFQVSDGA